MADRVTLVLMLIAAAVLGVGVVLSLSLWRSKPHRKWFYLYLTFYPTYWVLIVERLFALIDAPLAWQVGVEGMLLALAVVALVLFYRHRHDPDPDVA
jgi:hypothetical protein